MNYKTIHKVNLLIIILALWGCEANPNSSKESDRDILIELQQQQQKAHLNYDAELFTSIFNDHIVQIKNGRVVQRSKKESTERTKSYFEAVKFLEWDDIEPPRISISKDGTMAYVIVHKRVRLTYEDQEGETLEEHTIMAWLEVWEKIKDNWRLMAAASTDRPGA